MTLAASKGTVIKVQCVGDSAKKGFGPIDRFNKNNFGEETLSENIKRKKL